MNHLHFAIVFVLLCSVADNVRAAECTTEQFLSCAKDIAAGGGGGSDSGMDMGKMCSALTCLKSLGCEMGDSQPDLSSALKSVEPYCPSGGSGCSIQAFQKCLGVEDISKLGEFSPEFMAQNCGKKKCLADMLPSCKGAMVGTVESLIKSMDSICVGGCDKLQVMKCFVNAKPKNSSFAMDENFCTESKKASKCFEPSAKTCKGKMGEEMDRAVSMIQSVAQCCDKLVKVYKDCFPENVEELIEDDSFDNCKKKEDIYSCVMTSKIKCSGEIGQQIDIVKEKGKQAVENCEKQGYNLTISIESGKSLNDPGMGVALQPSATVLVALLLAVISWWF